MSPAAVVVVPSAYRALVATFLSEAERIVEGREHVYFFYDVDEPIRPATFDDIGGEPLLSTQTFATVEEAERWVTNELKVTGEQGDCDDEHTD